LDAVLAPPQQELNDSGRASTLFSSAVSTGWDAIDFLSLTPLHLSRSLVASSLAGLSDLHSFLFPPSSEEAFSLRSFVALVQREAVDEKQRERLPDGVRYSVAGVGKALVAWTALTGVTREWGEGKMLEGLREVDVEREWGSCSGMNQPLREGERRGDDPIGGSEKGGRADEEKVVVTGVDHEELGRQEVGETGQLESLTIVNASVGVDARLSSTTPSTSFGSSLSPFSSTSVDASSISPTHPFHSDLLRFSRIALGSYGGAGLLFFNVPIPRAMQPPVSQATQDASTVEEVLEVVEQVELAENETPQGAVEQKEQGKRTARDGGKQETSKKKGKVGLWDTIRGQHDQTICKLSCPSYRLEDANKSMLIIDHLRLRSVLIRPSRALCWHASFPHSLFRPISLHRSRSISFLRSWPYHRRLSVNDPTVRYSNSHLQLRRPSLRVLSSPILDSHRPYPSRGCPVPPRHHVAH
jgi:sn1-specific diacylglycerol lipase